MTFKRRIAYALIQPVLKMIFHLFWLTCRVDRIIGDEYAQQLIDKGDPILPCYWHQMHIMGIWYMRQLQKRGLKIGFLVSPSVDGEVPAKLVESWGAVAIRGSSTRTGARAIHDMYNTIVKDKISPLTTSDGPKGPIHEFKPGAVLLAQLTGAPVLPIAYAASRYWQLKTWDKFIIPKPFSRIVIVVGKPRYIDKSIKADQLESERLAVQNEMMAIISTAHQALQK